MSDQLVAETAAFRVIADAVPQIMWAALPDGFIDWYNARWYDYTGQTADEAEGWGWQTVHHPDDLPAVMQAWPASIASGEPFEMEFRLRGRDGTFRWFLTRATPLRDSDDRIIRWFGSNTDIDAEHRARVRERFFSELGGELSGALSLEQTLRVITQRIAPEFADWTIVNLVNERNEWRLEAGFHREPELDALLGRMRGASYMRQDATTGSMEVARTGKPLVYGTMSAVVRDDNVDVPYRDTFARLGQDSAIVVPLFSGGRIVGTMAAVMARSGRTFGESDVPFFEEVGRRIAPAIGNATAYERERRVATTFQQAALVRTLPDVPGLEFDAMYQAAMLEATVGGDWYDAFRLPDGRVVLSVGDVAGKGLGAAVAMASVRQSIRTAALINPEPVAVLNAVDRIVRAMDDAPFVTAFVAVIDPVDFALTYASAGHPPPLLRDPDGTVHALTEADLPLGIRQRSERGGVQLDIPRGSLLLCYTDGLTEFDRDPVLGEARLTHALEHAGDEHVAQRLYQYVAGGLPPHDDVAILAVRFVQPLTQRDGPRRAIAWRFKADDASAASRARAQFTQRLRDAGLGTDETVAAELVFGELIGNVVRYAPGPVVVILDVSGDAPVLHVTDRGGGFEFRPRLPADVLSERGRGLYLVNVFAEELTVERRHGAGSHARAVLRGRLPHRAKAGLGRDVLLERP